MKKIIVLAIGIFASFALSAFSVSYQAGTNLQTARMGHNSINLNNAKTLLIGGHGVSFVSLATAEIYNLADDSFSQLNMNYTHDGGAITVLPDQKILIAGGAADLGVAPGFNHAEIFNPVDNSFIPTGSMQRQRMMCSAALLSSGNVLLGGGWYDYTSAYEMEIYNPQNGQFAFADSLDILRSSPVILPCNDGDAIIFAGYPIYGGPNYQSVERYNAVTGKISKISDVVLTGIPSLVPYSDINYGRNLQEQRLTDGRYLLIGTYTDGEKSRYQLFTFNSATKEFAFFVTDRPLPTTDTLSLAAPLVDKAKNVCYLPQIKTINDVPVLSFSAINLQSGKVENAVESYSFPAQYYPYSGTVYSLLSNGTILLTGGHYATGYSTNFSPVNFSILITPDYQVGIENEIQPADLQLSAYPNPFNPATTINFYNTNSGRVQLTVINARGETVSRLIDGKLSAGNHSVNFNGTRFNSGIYFYKLETPEGSITKKLLLVK